MVAARNAQPPTSTASDQERKTLQEKIALIQSDDEVDVAVNSAATNDAFDDSEVLRESAASNDTYIWRNGPYIGGHLAFCFQIEFETLL